jgi:hypothetical protein
MTGGCGPIVQYLDESVGALNWSTLSSLHWIRWWAQPGRGAEPSPPFITIGDGRYSSLEAKQRQGLTLVAERCGAGVVSGRQSTDASQPLGYESLLPSLSLGQIRCCECLSLDSSWGLLLDKELVPTVS